MPTRAELFQAIKQDYPHLFDYMINLVLDLHEKNPDYIEMLIKNEKKSSKTKGAPKVKSGLSIEELDRLNAKFKEQEAEILKSSSATVVPHHQDAAKTQE